MKTKSFEGATEAEAQRRVADWIKSQPGIRVADTRIRAMSEGPASGGQPIRPPNRWAIIVQYEDGSN